MTNAVALIASITALIVALTGFVALFLRVGRVESKVVSTHILINSRMTELLDLTKTAAKAEGKLEGAAEEKAKPT